ncbi:hypothetical protein QBC41DRAFT_130229 [Cercophora samala]|uniref:Uncharacterized protein n=1 Tax=Cercophora samala TaxID=330535 RepID=A0AA40D9E6_9PEZI|nr:hypothetical protein QBC41DRAFT_130229 [Cercophora samala]
MPPGRPPGRPPWARRRRVRPDPIQDNFLIPGEFMTEIGLITNTPDYAVVRLPRCLISPRYEVSYMPIDTARILGGPSGEYPSREMTADETRRTTTFESPLGTISSNRTVVAVFEIRQLSLRFNTMRFPVLASNLCRAMRIDVILGANFIQWYQIQLAMRQQGQLSLAAAAGPQYGQGQDNEGLPNGGGGGQEDGNGDNINLWMQMPVVVAADEDVGMGGDMGGPELNGGG